MADLIASKYMEQIIHKIYNNLKKINPYQVIEYWYLIFSLTGIIFQYILIWFCSSNIY